MIDKINRERHEHIVTIEDPIEYLHSHKKCVVNQRELHADTHSLHERARVRPAPGPGRRADRRDARPRDDRGGAAHRRDRPPDLRHAAHQLGGVRPSTASSTSSRRTSSRRSARSCRSCSRASSASRCCRKASGKGRALALEIMVPNAAIRNLIREDKVHQIYSQMQTGQAQVRHADVQPVARDAVLQEADHARRRRSRARSNPDELQDMINRGAGLNAPTAGGRPPVAAAAGRRAPRRREIAMPSFVWKGRNRAGERSRRACSSPTRKDAAIAIAAPAEHRRHRSREKGKEIALPKIGRRGPAEGPRDLHAPVLRHDRRRPAARAVPRDPRRASRSNKTFQKILLQVRQDVEAGSTLADAMRKHPKAFDDLYVNMIAAGEAGGILDTILKRLATYIEKAVKLKAPGQGGADLPDRRHRRSPAIVVAVILLEGHPDLRGDVRGPRRASCRCRPGSSSRARTSSPATASSS